MLRIWSLLMPATIFAIEAHHSCFYWYNPIDSCLCWLLIVLSEPSDWFLPMLTTIFCNNSWCPAYVQCLFVLIKYSVPSSAFFFFYMLKHIKYIAPTHATWSLSMYATFSVCSEMEYLISTHASQYTFSQVFSEPTHAHCVVCFYDYDPVFCANFVVCTALHHSVSDYADCSV